MVNVAAWVAPTVHGERDAILVKRVANRVSTRTATNGTLVADGDDTQDWQEQAMSPGSVFGGAVSYQDVHRDSSSLSSKHSSMKA